MFTKTFQITVQAANGRVLRTNVKAKTAQQATDLALASLRRQGVRPVKAHAAQLVWAV